jgi:hypothetical protein
LLGDFQFHDEWPRRISRAPVSAPRPARRCREGDRCCPAASTATETVVRVPTPRMRWRGWTCGRSYASWSSPLGTDGPPPGASATLSATAGYALVTRSAEREQHFGRDRAQFGHVPLPPLSKLTAGPVSLCCRHNLIVFRVGHSRTRSNAANHRRSPAGFTAALPTMDSQGLYLWGSMRAYITALAAGPAILNPAYEPIDGP